MSTREEQLKRTFLRPACVCLALAAFFMVLTIAVSAKLSIFTLCFGSLAFINFMIYNIKSVD